MIELQIIKKLDTILFKDVIKYNNGDWLDKDKNPFSFSELEKGKYLINLVLVENNKNMVLQIEKFDNSRLTIRHDEEKELMGRAHNGNWRIMKDMQGYKE